MNKVNYEIYLMAMIELLINNKSQTDLGNYILEYKTGFDEVGTKDMTYGNACLSIAVKLKNKSNNLVEWGNVYYKRLIPNSNVVSTEAREKLEKIVQEINLKSTEEKLNFILKPETKVLKKPYIKNSFINNDLTSFFENLTYMADDGFLIIPLNGKLKKDALTSLEIAFNNIIGKIKNLNNNKIKR